MPTLWPISVTVFLAELGDKTQLATLLFAADSRVSKLVVLAASFKALVLSSLIAVVVGAQLSQYVSPRKLKMVAGLGFVAIGICALYDARPAIGSSALRANSIRAAHPTLSPAIP